MQTFFYSLARHGRSNKAKIKEYSYELSGLERGSTLGAKNERVLFVLWLLQ